MPVSADQTLTAHVFALIRERFYPLARFTGPLYAGPIKLDGQQHLYLNEANEWRIGVEEDSLRNYAPISDSALASATLPQAVLGYILLSMQHTIAAYLLYLEDLARVNPNLTTDLGAYLSNPEGLHMDTITLRQFYSDGDEPTPEVPGGAAIRPRLVSKPRPSRTGHVLKFSPRARSK